MAITLDQRREAREAVAHPGKFEGEPAIVPLLWGVVLDGGADEECDDSDGSTYCLIGRWVLLGDSQGFVHGKRHDSADAARVRFDRIAASIDQQYA